jgi:hydrogenase nickel incorporation protein HypB
MCGTCGCGGSEARIEGEGHLHEHVHEHVHEDGTAHAHAHDHDGDHRHDHGDDPGSGGRHEHVHAPGLSQARMVSIEKDILAKNSQYAQSNRRALADQGVFAVNLVSSPGSGKTTILVKTIEALRGRFPVAVIEGDQQTSQDAERIRATGAPAVQINTGKGCHLDAHMVGHALGRLSLTEGSALMIENVGNLVCPAAFDLGEAHKVVILSVTEGEDKPIKYPDMFRAATLMLLNKCDLLPHLTFDVSAAVGYARRVNPQLRIIRLSATSGEGMTEWLGWLDEGVAAAKSLHRETVEALKRRIAELERQMAAR